MEFFANPITSLAGLTVVSFLAATLLPGGSEAAFLALVLIQPEQSVPAWLLATLGNTLGGMTTYALVRWLPEIGCAVRERQSVISPTNGRRIFGAGETARAVAWLRRHGAPLLAFAWTPLIGDVLCGAAGWLRLPWLTCMLWMALGKGARYAAILWAAAHT
jgi:membrane protein YqaA with SNARE-associated domain